MTTDELELEKIRLEKRLEAEEAVRAADRELTKLREQLALDREKIREQTSAEMRKAMWDAEHALQKAFHDNVAEVAKGSIDRARKGAEFLEKAALSIAGLYTGLLGLVFSVTDNPLPGRGVYPAIFFGLAIASAAGYLAFLRRADLVTGRKRGKTLAEIQDNRTFFLADWITAGVFKTRYLLRVGVLALMVGVAFLPAPFVDNPTAPDEAPDYTPIDPPVPDEDIDDPEQRDARFRADLAVYEEAARQVISSQAAAPRPASAEDDSAWWTWALGIGLAVCLVGPYAYGKVDDRRST